MMIMRPRATGGGRKRIWWSGGVGLVTPRLMTHGGEGLEEEMNEGGEECRDCIGGRTVEG